jgi:hypothetical protein
MMRVVVLCPRRNTLAIIFVCCGMLFAGCDQTSHISTAANRTGAHVVSRTAVVRSTANAMVSTRRRLKPIPLPDEALLSPQPEPDCGFKITEPKTDDVQKLDYQRQCYRHAEMIVRSRLEQLQGSVEMTIKAVKGDSRDAKIIVRNRAEEVIE